MSERMHVCLNMAKGLLHRSLMTPEQMHLQRFEQRMWILQVIICPKKNIDKSPPKNYTYVVYRKMDGCTYNVFHVCRRVWHDKMWQAQTQLCSSQRLKVASMTPAAGKQHPGTFICTTQRSLVCRCWTPKGKVLYECLWGGVFLFCFFFYFGGFNQRVGWWMQTTC